MNATTKRAKRDYLGQKWAVKRNRAMRANHYK